MDYNRQSNATQNNSYEDLHRFSRRQYLWGCLQGPSVKVMTSDNGDSEELYHCKCGQNIFASPGRHTHNTEPNVNVVTYKKQIGQDKMVVVKQELEKPIVTLWVVFHAVMFIFFFILVLIIIQIASLNVSKADEIMAVLALLLFILVYFHPRYFFPFLIFHLGTRRERIDYNNEEYHTEP